MDQIGKELARMSLREKVGSLFIVRPESLEPQIRYASDAELPPYRLQAVSEGMRGRARRYPAGGVLLYGHNIEDPEQLLQFGCELKALPGTPLLCIDEEGGRVSRIAANPAFEVSHYESAAAIAAGNDPEAAYEAAFSIGSYLRHYGLDIDFAPVADVNTNPRNIIIGARAFSDDPRKAAPMVAAFVRGLSDAGIAACLKHFPGHGDTLADTHLGHAFTRKDWEEISSCEMVPFRAGIAAGVPLVMAAHIAAPGVTGSDIPATLSPEILTGKLRGELGFRGLVITDALEMGAITRRYGSAEAAVRAFEAGADLLLCPLDYCEAFDAVLDAVGEGRIGMARLEASVMRILGLRQSLGRL
ncbi:MAG: glycoside hydrolase [Bacteroidales bacterium]|nr:glycoside hydrolase [Bacteroidales bacterium]